MERSPRLCIGNYDYHAPCLPHSDSASSTARAIIARRIANRRRRSARLLGGVRLRSRGWSVTLQRRSLDQYWNSSPGTEGKDAVSKNPQQTRNFSRVRGDRDVRAIIARKDIIEHFLRPDVLICARLGVQSGPVGVLLRKAFLELVRGEVLVDVGFGAAAIARVC
jgi:hypothetical protein